MIKKLILEDPIDEPQEGEKPRHYYFLNLYFDTDIGLYKFIKSFDGLKKGMVWICSGYDGEVKLEFNPPTQKTMQVWATQLSWESRKTAHWAYFFKRGKEKRAKKVEEYLDGFLDDVMDSTTNLKNTEDEIDDDYETKPHLKAKGKSDISSSRSNYWGILKDLGGISDPTKKIEADLNAEGEFGVETKLNIEDNKALSTVQSIFMQPEFVEMNKKLMEKTADELQKQRKNRE